MPVGLLGPLIGGAIAGGSAIAGSAISSHGANKAADTQAAAANRAAELQKQAADESLAFQKQQYGENVTRQQPWLTAGTKAVGELSNLPAFQAPGAAGMNEDPGYQFRLSEGQKLMERSAAGRGAALGGGALKAAEDYGQAAGSQEYSNVYKRRMDEYNSQLGQLQGLAGIGQTAGQNLGAAGSTAAGQVGSTLMNSATNQGTAMLNAGAARASGYQNNGAIWGNVANSVGNTLSDLYSMRQPPTVRMPGVDISQPLGGDTAWGY
jgi:hypothetical protein